MWITSTGVHCPEFTETLNDNTVQNIKWCQKWKYFQQTPGQKKYKSEYLSKITHKIMAINKEMVYGLADIPWHRRETNEVHTHITLFSLMSGKCVLDLKSPYNYIVIVMMSFSRISNM